METTPVAQNDRLPEPVPHRVDCLDPWEQMVIHELRSMQYGTLHVSKHGGHPDRMTKETTHKFGKSSS